MAKTKKAPVKKKAVAKKTPTKKKVATKKKTTGRPTKYTKALGDKICLRLACGESLNSIAKDPKMPARSTMCLWAIDEDHPFSDKYAKARKIQAECLADELFDVADDGTNDWVEKNDPENPGYVINGEAVSRSRLRVDTRKWYLARIVPRFKDKSEVEHSGAIDLSSYSDEELEKIASGSKKI